MQTTLQKRARFMRSGQRRADLQAALALVVMADAAFAHGLTKIRDLIYCRGLADLAISEAMDNGRREKMLAAMAELQALGISRPAVTFEAVSVNKKQGAA